MKRSNVGSVGRCGLRSGPGRAAWWALVAAATALPAVSASAGAVEISGHVVCTGAGDPTDPNKSVWLSNHKDYSQSIVPAGLPPVVEVAAGGFHTLARTKSGLLVAWGLTDAGQGTVSTTIGACSAIAAGWKHNVAVRVDGSVVAWGLNNSGQCDVPEISGPCVAVSAGVNHSVALGADGTVHCWGSNENNQCAVPANLPACIAVAAGGFHTLALAADGTVWGWGGNNGGQDFGQGIPPADLGPCVAIAGGRNHSAALRADGTIRAWGYNCCGQIPNGMPIPGHPDWWDGATGSTFAAVACGQWHTMGVVPEQLVAFGWGDNSSGQTLPVVPGGRIVGLSCGAFHTVVLVGTDCDGNGILDDLEIDADPGLDCDGSGTLDECEPVTADTVRQWRSGDSGAFNDAANWCPAPPSPSSRVLFPRDGEYTVSFATSRTTRSAAVSAGDVTLALNGRTWTLQHLPEPAQAQLTVGVEPEQPAVLRMVGGTVLSSYAAVGVEPGAAGILEIGAGSKLTTLSELCVGCGGVGAMDLAAGGRAVSQKAIIGSQAGSWGEASVHGANSEWEAALGIDVKNGTLVLRDGGVIDSPALGVVIYSNGSLHADGVINGPVTNFGTVRGATTTGTGQLLVNGFYQQIAVQPELGNASGSLRVDLVPGPNGPTCDNIVVTGGASLGGGLFVSLPKGDPGSVSAVPVITSAGGFVEGHDRFDVAVMPAIGSGKFLKVNQGGTSLAPGAVTLSLEDLATLMGFGQPGGPSLPALPAAACAADVDGNGTVDLAVALQGATPQDAGALIVFQNDGNGQLAGTVQIPLGQDPAALVSGRFRPNGPVDLAVVNRGSESVQVLHNSGSGIFTPGPSAALGAGSQPVALAALAPPGGAQDGGQDGLVVINQGFGTAVVFGTEGGTLTVKQILQAGFVPSSVSPADLDNDRDTDMVVPGQGSPQALVFPYDAGRGGYGDPVVVQVGEGPTGVLTADLDDDGWQDFVTVSAGGATVSVVLNRTAELGAMGFAPAVTLPTGANPASILAEDLDQDGDLDLAYLEDAASNSDRGAPPALRVVGILRNDLARSPQGNSLVLAPDASVVASGTPLVLLAAPFDAIAGPDLVTLNAAGSLGAAAGGPVATVELRGSTPSLPCVPADLDCNGVVNGADLGVMLASWGPCPGCAADVNGDGVVNGADLGVLLASWGG
ncbi:MAG: FG-GAP-like repeat-containing protein [Phycisphaerales bacterium]